MMCANIEKQKHSSDAARGSKRPLPEESIEIKISEGIPLFQSLSLGQKKAEVNEGIRISTDPTEFQITRERIEEAATKARQKKPFVFAPPARAKDPPSQKEIKQEIALLKTPTSAERTTGYPKLLPQEVINTIRIRSPKNELLLNTPTTPLDIRIRSPQIVIKSPSPLPTPPHPPRELRRTPQGRLNRYNPKMQDFSLFPYRFCRFFIECCCILNLVLKKIIFFAWNRIDHPPLTPVSVREKDVKKLPDLLVLFREYI